MKQAIQILLFALLICSVVPPASPDEIVIETEKEIDAEIARRREDIARTEYRLATIAAAEMSAQEELERARKDGDAIERQAVARARTFYRLSRNGGSVRYLLGASSPVDLLKRLTDLKRLLVQGLEARRQSGNRITQAEKRVTTLLEEKAAAYRMKEMLVDALAELESEKTNGMDRPAL